MVSVRRWMAESRSWPGAVALGLAVVVPASLGPRWLAQGGLAPLAVATLVALCVAAPLAAIEVRAATRFGSARDRGELRPVDRVLGATAEVLALLLVASIAAPLVAAAGLTGQSMALGGWLLVGLATRRAGFAPAAVLAVAAVLLGLVGGAVAAAETPPWTLLEPHWASWREWMPGALAVGLLLAPAGLGQWATGPAVPPGGARIAWTTAGLAILLAVGSAVRAGARFEAALGVPPVDSLAQVTLTLAVGAGACAVVGRAGDSRARWTRVGLGVLGTLWFTGPAAAALPVFLSMVVPLGMAVILGIVAWHATGGARLLAAFGAALAVVAAGGAPVSLPTTVSGAGALALTIVGMFWYVATRAVETR